MSIGDIGIGSGKGVGESYDVVSKTYSIDFVLDLPTNGYYAMDLVSVYSVNKTYELDQRILRRPTIGIAFSTYFSNPIAQYDVSTMFITDIRSRLPTDSIINTLWFSWATVLDQTYRNIKQAIHSMNIARADSTDLDTIGNVYHLGRLVGEEDDNYRKRLFTQSSVLTGHGTKLICESIIDQATGIIGSEVNTSIPGTVRIEFSNDDSMHAAYEIRTTLESIIPNMLAAGIYWTLYTPIKDYYMDGLVIGTINCPYTTDVLHRNTNENSYDMDMCETLRLIETFAIDILNNKALNKQFYLDIFMLKNVYETYTCNGIFSKKLAKSYVMICPNKKIGVITTTSLDSLIKLKNIDVAYLLDSLFEKDNAFRYLMTMVVVL